MAHTSVILRSAVLLLLLFFASSTSTGQANKKIISEYHDVGSYNFTWTIRNASKILIERRGDADFARTPVFSFPEPLSSEWFAKARGFDSHETTTIRFSLTRESSDVPDAWLSLAVNCTTANGTQIFNTSDTVMYTSDDRTFIFSSNWRYGFIHKFKPEDILNLDFSMKLAYVNTTSYSGKK